MKTALDSAVFDEREHDGYEDLLAVIRESFEKNIKGGDAPLFRTDARDLYELFLQNIPAEARQHYNCNACRHFVNHYGGIVTVNEKGSLVPVMWTGTVPDFFKKAVAAIKKKVSGATITSVFATGELRLGTPVTGPWTHMAVDVPKKMAYFNWRRSPFQEEAKKNEERKMLAEAIGNYRDATVDTAVTILKSDALYRGEKVLGVAEWFQDVLKNVRGKRNGKNLIWKYAATAPVGFCHISSSMIGTLLDDIEAGYGIETVQRRFAQKMNPTQYQRPQAKPSAGNVAQAEKIVEKLGIERSLDRRFARLEELKTVWKPTPAKATATGGVFAGVETKNGRGAKKLVELPDERITWEKFQRTVLPHARKIEYKVGPGKENFAAILTAADFDAPPIVQWDTEDLRNPFTWYVYIGGSYPGRWGLRTGYVEVTGVAMQPNLWQSGYENHGKSVFFILKGCKDSSASSLCLFPDCLKSDLHEIRAAIEAYSHQHSPSGYEQASACGIRLQANAKWWDYTFRVTTDDSVRTYNLDRWD